MKTDSKRRVPHFRAPGGSTIALALTAALGSSGEAHAGDRIVLTLFSGSSSVASSQDDRIIGNFTGSLRLAVSVRNPPPKAERVRVRIKGISCHFSCHTQRTSKALGPRLETSEGTFRAAKLKTHRWGCGDPKIRIQVVSRSGRVVATKRWTPNTECSE